MKVKEEREKTWLKTRHFFFFKDHGQINGVTEETVTDFIFLGSKITADGDCNHEI